MTMMKLISFHWKLLRRAIERIQKYKGRVNLVSYTRKKVKLGIFIKGLFYLIILKGEKISEDEDGEEEEENSETETENDPTDLEKIFNERSNALISVSSSKLDPKKSQERKPRKTKKRTTQLAFDFALLRFLELETSKKLKTKMKNCCPRHLTEISKECFDCSLINIIP